MWDSSHTHTHHTINQIGASHKPFAMNFVELDKVIVWEIVENFKFQSLRFGCTGMNMNTFLLCTWLGTKIFTTKLNLFLSNPLPN